MLRIDWFRKLDGITQGIVILAFHVFFTFILDKYPELDYRVKNEFVLFLNQLNKAPVSEKN